MLFEVTAHDHHVCEIAHHVVQPGVVPIGHRHAHRNIGLAGMAHQQHAERRQEGREKSGALLLCERTPRRSQFRLDPEGQGAPGITCLRRARLVDGQLQGLQVAQIGAPIVQMALERLALEVLALAHDMVRKLQFRFGHAGGIAAPFIEVREFAVNDGERPAVGHDVVHQQHQHAMVGRKLKQFCTQQGCLGQIKGLGNAVDNALCQRLLRHFARRQRRACEAEVRQRLGRRHDLLHRLLLRRPKHRAQAGVTSQEGPQAALQALHIEWASQSRDRTDVVGRAATGELVEKPQRFLGK